jgi:chromosome segregation ATPase
VPLNSAVQEFSRTIAAVADALRQAAKEHNQAQRDLTRGREELNRIDASQHVPDRNALIAQRNRRDAGWQLVRRVYVEGQTDERDVRQWLGDEVASLPDRYQEAVVEADHLADTRQDKAEIVAKRDQLVADVARFENRLREANAELLKWQRKRDGLEQSWQELWNACRLSPKSPEVMTEWIHLHTQLTDKLQDCLEPKRRLHQVQQRVSTATASLTCALPTITATRQAFFWATATAHSKP